MNPGRNQDWNEIPMQPLDAIGKKNPFAELISGDSKISARASEAVVSPLPEAAASSKSVSRSPEAAASSKSVSPSSTKRTRFSDAKDIIEYEMSPQDRRNSWNSRNIPRTLVNLGRIAQTHGMVASYPKSAVDNGVECMIRIEPSPVVDEICRIKDKHRQAVLAEQRRQQAEGGEVDAEKLCEVAAEHSDRSVEIAKSSWWLDRMNYRSFI